MSEMERKISCIAANEFKHSRNLEVLSPIYNAMKACYGPYGGTTLITSNGQAEFTKDGISILGSLIPGNDIVRPFLSILKETAARSDLKAGDGTTTVTLGIIDVYRAAQERGITISTDFLNKVANYLYDNKKTVVDYDDMLNVVKVACNHKEEFYSVFKEIFDEQKEAGVSLHDFDITTRTIDDASSKEDVVISYEKTVGVKTMAMPLYSKGLEELNGCTTISISHAITTTEHVEKFTSLMSAWYKTVGPTSSRTLLILVPSINEVMKKRVKDLKEAYERVLSSQAKMPVKLNIEMLETISPVAEGADAAVEIGLALCAPVMQLVTQMKISINDESEEAQSALETYTPTEVFEFYLKKLAEAPQTDLRFNEFDMSTRIISKPETVNSALALEKDKAVKALEQAMKNPLVSPNKKEEMKQRMNLLVGGSIIIVIKAHSGKKIRFIEDTFKDSCLHLRRAKSGVVAGMNIAILKAIARTEPANEHEAISKDILFAAYFNMCITLVTLKEQYCQKRMIPFSASDVLSKIEGLVITPESQLTIGYDLKKDEISSDVLSSVDNEITLMKTIVEVTNLLMETNQITFDDDIMTSFYRSTSTVFY